MELIDSLSSECTFRQVADAERRGPREATGEDARQALTGL